MRSLLIWSDYATSPEHPEVPPVTPVPTSEGMAVRPDYLPVFDPASGISRDGETVYLTARVEPAAFDGSMVAPEALVVKVFHPDTHEELAGGRTPILGPGPIAVGIPGLEPGNIYRFDLVAEYPD